MRVHTQTARTDTPSTLAARTAVPTFAASRGGRSAIGRILRSTSKPASRPTPAPTPDSTPAPEQAASSIQDMQGDGAPLSEDERAFFEPRFGQDFSHVRIHDHGHAAAVARTLRASAFTVGSDIFFGRGNYQPNTQQGRALMAHELSHVIQQRAHAPRAQAMVVQRNTTRGAGGCGPPRDIDEDLSGARGAGLSAHRQIQMFLLPSVLGELIIPRATKTNMASQGCQSPGVNEGRADLWKQGMRIGLGEIKPFGWANSYGVSEVEHYIRRARQSADRTFSSGACATQASGTDDQDFARRIGMGAIRKQFTELRGILPTDTIIGAFDGDPTRTLKARLVAPGAVGYWCTGGASDTYTCGVSQRETERFIDQAMIPAQDAVDRFIEERFERPLERSISNFDVGQGLVMAQRLLGPQIERALAPYLGPVGHLMPREQVVRYVGDLIAQQIGPTARAVIMTVARRLKSLILNELRIQLRNSLRALVQQVLAAACVGVPVVTLAKLLDELSKRLMNQVRQLAPAILTAVAARLAVALVQMLEQMLQAVYSAISRVLSVVFDIILRILAVIAIVLLVVVAIVLFIIAFILIFDVAPGDEAAVAMAAVALLTLIVPLGRFVATGSTSANEGA